MAKDRIIYQEKYKKGTLISNKLDVINVVKKSNEFHLIDKGRMESGKEFITIKIVV